MVGLNEVDKESSYGPKQISKVDTKKWFPNKPDNQNHREKSCVKLTAYHWNNNCKWKTSVILVIKNLLQHLI